MINNINAGDLGSVDRAILNAVIDYHNATAEPNIVKHKFDAITYPVVGNDNTEGYTVGSCWCDTTNDLLWQAIDVTTGTAVWKKLTKIHTAATTPTVSENLSSGYAIGDCWVNTGAGSELYVCTASSVVTATWVSISDLWSSSTDTRLKVAQVVNMQEKLINDLATPVSQMDAATLESIGGVVDKVDNDKHVNDVDFSGYDSFDVPSGSAILKNLAGGNSVHNGLGSILAINPVDNTLINITTAAPTHSDNARALWIRTSITDGMTWTAWNELSSQFTYSTGIKPICLDYIKHGEYKGRLIFSYRDVYVAYCAYSDDNGVNWIISNEIKTLDPDTANYVSGDSNYYTLHVSSSQLIEWYDKDGILNIGMPVHTKHESGGNFYFSQGMVVSKDGSTFPDGSYIGTTPILSTTRSEGEPVVANLGKGVFVLVARDQLSSPAHWGGLVQYISYDYGESWTYQGIIPYDVKYIDNSSKQYLPCINLVYLNDEPVWTLGFTSRNTAGTNYKRIFARAKDLLGDYGHLGWNEATLEIIFAFSATNNSGNGSCIYPYNNSRGLYTGSNQFGSTNSDFRDEDIGFVASEKYALMNDLKDDPNWTIAGKGTPSTSSLLLIADTSKFKVGSPIRYYQYDTSIATTVLILPYTIYYGVVEAIVTDVSITISGIPMRTAPGANAEPIDVFRIDVGNTSLISTWDTFLSGLYASYTAGIGTGLLYQDNLQRYRYKWNGGKAYIVKMWAGHSTPDSSVDSTIVVATSLGNTSFNAACSPLTILNNWEPEESGVIMNNYYEINNGYYIDFTSVVGSTGDAANTQIGLVIVSE